MIKGKRMYAVVRMTESGEWLDDDTLSVVPEISRDRAERTDRLIGGWAKENPILRLVEVEVNELATVEVMK